MTSLTLLESYRREGGTGRYRRFKMVLAGEVLLDLNDVASVTLGESSMIVTIKNNWGTLYVTQREAFPSVMEYLAKHAREELGCDPNDLPVT